MSAHTCFHTHLVCVYIYFTIYFCLCLSFPLLLDIIILFYVIYLLLLFTFPLLPLISFLPMSFTFPHTISSFTLHYDNVQNKESLWKPKYWINFFSQSQHCEMTFIISLIIYFHYQFCIHYKVVSITFSCIRLCYSVFKPIFLMQVSIEQARHFSNFLHILALHCVFLEILSCMVWLFLPQQI